MSLLSPVRPHRPMYAGAASLALLTSLFLIPDTATGQQVFRCKTPQGTIYQQTQCADAAHESQVEIRDTDRRPDTAKPFLPKKQQGNRVEYVDVPIPSSGQRESTANTALECRASDGRVFYRHDSCPQTLPPANRLTTVRLNPYDFRPEVVEVDQPDAKVVTNRVDRSTACAAINHRNADSRAGSKEDQRISTYDRNLGRDPCKR